MNSLDPRVNRLPKVDQPGPYLQTTDRLDQFGTYEVFVQPKEGKPFQHAGIVHAPNIEMAFVLAKETFTRRFTCSALCVAETANILVSPMVDGDQNAYDLVDENVAADGQGKTYEIYHLLKRGRQHIHAGNVNATTHAHALARAKQASGGKKVLNIWVLRTQDIRFTTPEEMDLWKTLPDKKFRDASAFKGGEKLKEYLDRVRPSNV